MTVLALIAWGVSPKSSNVTATWPAVIPVSPEIPLSVGRRPWLTVSAGVASFSAATLPAPAIVVGLKLFPPSEETSTVMRLGLKGEMGIDVLMSMLAHET